MGGSTETIALGGAPGWEPERPGVRADLPGWRVAVVPSVGAALGLLDLLEAKGFRQREFSRLGGSGYEVRWR